MTQRGFRTGLLAALALALAACSTAPQRTTPAGTSATRLPGTPPRDPLAVPDAVPRDEPRSRYGNPASYEVFGRRYFVLPSAAGYVERGTASWYGPGFHAARTSSGEAYDMYAMSAAHKTLPIPVYARVTNLRNGRSVVVRINDRGPFVGDRLIDLSYTAAAKLDMLRDGTAPVEVRVLGGAAGQPPPVAAPQAATAPQAAAAPMPAEPASATDPATQAAPARTSIQAGAFSSAANAAALVARLARAGIGNAGVRNSIVRGMPRFVVRIGPLADSIEVEDMLERLRLAGVTGAIVAPD